MLQNHWSLKIVPRETYMNLDNYLIIVSYETICVILTWNIFDERLKTKKVEFFCLITY